MNPMNLGLAAALQGLRRWFGAWRHRLWHLAARGDPAFARSRSALAAMGDRFAGQTCVILGNGPSLAALDLREIEGFKTFCLNRGYLLWNRQHRTPDFLVVVNNLLIEQFADEFAAVTATKFLPWERHGAFQAEREDIVFFEERWDEQFQSNPLAGIASMGTVTNVALQLAYHMGFSRVVLLGIDHSFVSTGRPHSAIVQQEADANHFDPAYFGPGTKWHLPDLAMSERGYLQAREAFERVGRTIINATPGTCLDIFETMGLQAALHNR